ncbi:hypothetical protein N7486_009658 [Penicillium sp. IBT 16267x]|nr:hypothetical protein N7486_009658 [Penicillium sp. IBT 16267x]
MASQAPSPTSGSQSEGPSPTRNLQGACTIDPRIDDDMTYDPTRDPAPSLIPPGEVVTCLECLTWIAAGRRPAEICSFSHSATHRDVDIPNLQCIRCARKHHICYQVRSARLRGLLRILERLWAQGSHLIRRVDYARQI